MHFDNFLPRTAQLFPKRMRVPWMCTPWCRYPNACFTTLIFPGIRYWHTLSHCDLWPVSLCNNVHFSHWEEFRNVSKHASVTFKIRHVFSVGFFHCLIFIFLEEQKALQAKQVPFFFLAAAHPLQYMTLESCADMCHQLLFDGDALNLSSASIAARAARLEEHLANHAAYVVGMTMCVLIGAGELASSKMWWRDTTRVFMPIPKHGIPKFSSNCFTRGQMPCKAFAAAHRNDCNPCCSDWLGNFAYLFILLLFAVVFAWLFTSRSIIHPLGCCNDATARPVLPSSAPNKTSDRNCK